MKTLIVKEPGCPVYTEEYPKPTPKSDEVLIRVLRNGVCATDIAILTGTAPFMHDGSTTYPVRFGHEFVGDVVEVGSDVKNYQVGDRAISVGYVSCGECPECLSGNDFMCPNIQGVGTLNTYPGSYAEYVLFPERFLIKLPKEMDVDTAALIEPAGVGMRGVTKANITPDSYVLVTGVGAIGISAAAFAKHRGAKKVIISGRTPHKLEIAKRMGVDVVCNPREESLVECVMRETNGHGIDSLIECSGNIGVLNDCVKVLAKGATMTVLAFYEQLYREFDIDQFVMKEATLNTVMDHATPEVIQAIEEGVDLSPLITRHIRFEDCGAFMEQILKEKNKDDIKVMVDFE